MRVRALVLTLVACSAVVAPALASDVGIGQPETIEISSGGDPARHVCRVGAPCTLQFAPLMLSVEDRLDVVAVGATAVSIGDGHACAARAAGRWACRVPDETLSAADLGLTVTHPEGTSRYVFDVVLLPRGFRATARVEGVRFRLAGRHLRMQLVPRDNHHPPDARAELWGKRLNVGCARRQRGPFGKPRVAFKRMYWPRGALTRSVLFDRPFFKRPRWCVIEAGPTGGDVAAVRFSRR
jgi:hypothetical protein